MSLPLHTSVTSSAARSGNFRPQPRSPCPVGVSAAPGSAHLVREGWEQVGCRVCKHASGERGLHLLTLVSGRKPRHPNVSDFGRRADPSAQPLPARELLRRSVPPPPRRLLTGRWPPRRQCSSHASSGRPFSRLGGQAAPCASHGAGQRKLPGPSSRTMTHRARFPRAAPRPRPRPRPSRPDTGRLGGGLLSARVGN